MLAKINHFLLVLIILLGSIHAKAIVAAKTSTPVAMNQVTSSKSIRKISKRKRSLKERILTKILKRKIKRHLSKTKPQKEPISAEKMSELGIWAIALSGLSLLLFYGLAVGSSAYIFALILVILAGLLSLFAIVASIIASHNKREAKDKKIIIRAVIGIVLGIIGFLTSALFTFFLFLSPY